MIKTLALLVVAIVCVGRVRRCSAQPVPEGLATAGVAGLIGVLAVQNVVRRLHRT